MSAYLFTGKLSENGGMRAVFVSAFLLSLSSACTLVPRDGQSVTSSYSADPHVFQASDSLYLLTATGGVVLGSPSGCTGYASLGSLWNNDAGLTEFWAPHFFRVSGRDYVTTTGRRTSCTLPSLVACRTIWWAPLNGSFVSIRTSALRRFTPEAGCSTLMPRSYDGTANRTLWMGLDSDVWEDPLTKEVWLSYSTDYTDTEQHVGIVQLNSQSLAVKCSPPTFIRPFSNVRLLESDQSMANYVCSFGVPWPCSSGFTASATGRWVYEGSSLMRRGSWIYLFFSASEWSSSKYGVFFIAARTVAGLADAQTRLRGQFVPPTAMGVYGHGRPFQALDGRWFFSFHRNNPGSPDNRTAWVAPVTFVDRADGLGDVWIRPIQPGHALSEPPPPRPAPLTSAPSSGSASVSASASRASSLAAY